MGHGICWDGTGHGGFDLVRNIRVGRLLGSTGFYLYGDCVALNGIWDKNMDGKTAGLLPCFARYLLALVSCAFRVLLTFRILIGGFWAGSDGRSSTFAILG